MKVLEVNLLYLGQVRQEEVCLSDFKEFILMLLGQIAVELWKRVMIVLPVQGDKILAMTA